MNITVIDGSGYFKGLLLLIRKDNKITKEEQELMIRIGRSLGFENNFIENAISEILNNRYISNIPPVFSTKELAEKFMKDGYILAASDRDIHPHEEAWLYSIADRNNIEKEWMETLKKNVLNIEKDKRPLEVDNLKVVY